MVKMNYLIVSPVRSGSTWLNKVLAHHYKLYDIGETLCKLSPAYLGSEASPDYQGSLKNINDLPIRDMNQIEQLQLMKDKAPVVIKFTPFDLYDTDDIRYDTTLYREIVKPTGIDYSEFGYGYPMDYIKKYVDPITIIFLYRKNIPENFLSFLAMHNTGVHNAHSPFMNYRRPKKPIKDTWVEFYKMHFDLMNKCYKDHIDDWDHVISYEELFKMDELCGVPLKQYHDQFTLKLNQYDREEIEEVKRLTGYSENYDITK